MDDTKAKNKPADSEEKPENTEPAADDQVREPEQHDVVSQTETEAEAESTDETSTDGATSIPVRRETPANDADQEAEPEQSAPTEDTSASPDAETDQDPEPEAEPEVKSETGSTSEGETTDEPQPEAATESEDEAVATDDAKVTTEPESDDTDTTEAAETKNAATSDSETPTEDGGKEPDQASAPVSSAVTSTPPHASHTGLVLLIIALILAAAGSGAYYVLNHKAATAKNAAASATAEKDIANIRYVTTNDGWDRFYPGIDDSSNYQEANSQIFEGLVRYENKSKIVPLLATSWNTPNPTTWVFNLKQGVKFHTGREMTAQDVKDSFDAAKNSDIGQVFATTITSVSVTGPYQVTIKTDAPDATLLNKLTGYYVYDTKSGKDNDPINGTGAYTIKPGTTAKPDSLELVAFDQYHGGRPHVRSVSFVGLSDGDHGKAYNDNKAGIVSFSGDAPTAVKSRKFNQIKLQPLGVQMMVLNANRSGSPLQKLKVRQALEETFDQAAIAKARGVSFETASQAVPQAIPGYNPAIKHPAADPTAAKKLIADAGYPSGFTMKLTYFAPLHDEAAEIAKEAAAAGITVNLDEESDGSAMSDIAYGGKTDAYLVTNTSDIQDSSDVLSQANSSINFHDQKVEDLVAKAQATFNTAQHLKFLQQANQAMMDNADIVPLFTQVDQNSIIYDPSYVIQRDMENNNLGIYFWKVYGK